MSHIDTLKAMFLNKSYVPISEIRNWCNYRSRISDLRKRGMDIRPTIITKDDGSKIHTYYLYKETQKVFDLDKTATIV